MTAQPRSTTLPQSVGQPRSAMLPEPAVPEPARVCHSRRMDTTGLVAAAIVLLLGSAFGIWRRRTDGALRPVAAASTGPTPAAGPLAPDLAAPDLAAPDLAAPDLAAPDLIVSDLAAPDLIAPDRIVPDPTATDLVAPDGGAAGLRIDADLLAALGVRPAAATLLQFSSAFCAPCRAVRRISSEVAAMVPRVQHVEVDAESHLDAVRALGIWRTPTLLVLDADGRVVKRATGVPGKAQLIAALGDVLPTP